MNNLVDNPKYSEKAATFREQAFAMIKATGDPLLEIHQDRDDTEAVQAYLSRLDAESKARKSKPEIYNRGWAK